ncbi:MAG: prepilin-type N-terminal cleavage/methylation domain-containing protein [Verrucomicrobiales bacterium]
MGLPTHQESGHYSRREAFTLIEIVVALTIIAVIAAVAIPTMNGLNDEEEAAAPLRDLAEMVQEARQRATHERRTYQIVFERAGVHACEFSFPQVRRTEFLKQLAEARTPPKKEDIVREQILRTEVTREEFAAPLSPSTATARPLALNPATSLEVAGTMMPWTQTISLPPKAECAVLLWGDGEWDILEGEKIRRWVFQPLGIANPARVRLRLDGAERESSFDALTGELRSQRSRLRTAQP